MVGVLPGLRKHAVVPVDVVGIETKLALFGVLLHWVVDFIGGEFHLGRGFLGDFAHEVEKPVSSEQRDVVPCRDGGALLVVEDAELQGFSRALKVM